MNFVTITFEVADADSDVQDDTGLANEAYERFTAALTGAGAVGITDVRQVSP